jgi:hypothetical protein
MKTCWLFYDVFKYTKFSLGHVQISEDQFNRL